VNNRTWRHWASISAIATLCLTHAPLGWCPPPPGFLLPDNQTFDFGKVFLNQTDSLTISYLVNPAYAASGPFVISNSPYFFYFNQDGAFAVDIAHTTCVPGFSITTTSGCSVTVSFTPTSLGSKIGQFFELFLCQGTLPSCGSPTIGSALTFTGTGVIEPSAVPTLSSAVLLLLAVLSLPSGAYVLRSRERAP
jgi:hypothetical protein